MKVAALALKPDNALLLIAVLAGYENLKGFKPCLSAAYTSLGKLTAQNGIMKTFNDVVEDLVSRRVPLSPEMLKRLQEFVIANERFGYAVKEEFISDAIRFKLTMLSQCEYIEIPKEQHGLLNNAIRKMNTPHSNAEDFINTKIREALEKYQEWKEQR